MKKILASLIITTISAGAHASADAIHCDAMYKDKPFAHVIIWDMDFGHAECDYKNKDDDDSAIIKYELPRQNEYYKVAGRWRSAMPGIQWCSVKDGNQFSTCLFAKRVVGK